MNNIINLIYIKEYSIMNFSIIKHIPFGRAFVLPFAASVIFCTSACNAEVIEIEETAEYVVGDNETRIAATEAVISLARRRASEKAGVYLESYSKTENLAITKDQIQVMSASIMKDKESPDVKTMLTASGAIKLNATIKVLVDTSLITEQESNLKTRTNSDDKYAALEESYKQLAAELLALKQSMSEKSTNTGTFSQNSTKNSSIDKYKTTHQANSDTIFAKYFDPNTDKPLDRTEWCLYYELYADGLGPITPSYIHVQSKEPHERAIKGPHSKEQCWRWVPVELGGQGDLHIRLSADKKYYEFFKEGNAKTVYKMRVRRKAQKI